MSKTQSGWPWSVPISAQDIRVEGQQYHLVADAQTRAGVAKLAGQPEVPRLEASVVVVPQGNDGLRVTGRVTASVAQTCVVTLEPMQSEVDEVIDVLYLRNPSPDALEAGGAGEEPGKVGDERIEPLVNDTIDLGVVATEFLILGIDLYPRKPEAGFAQPTVEEPSPGPFSALAALKKSRNSSSG